MTSEVEQRPTLVTTTYDRYRCQWVKCDRNATVDSYVALVVYVGQRKMFLTKSIQCGRRRYQATKDLILPKQWNEKVKADNAAVCVVCKVQYVQVKTPTCPCKDVVSDRIYHISSVIIEPLRFPVPGHSRPQRPRSFWSAPRNHDLWPGPTPEVHDSRTSRHSAHVQSQV